VAYLVEKQTGRRFPISSSCIVGRGPHCALSIDDAFASAEHARIFWNGVAWQIRDLGSRNGTFVDGRPLAPGVPLNIDQGSCIGFGRAEANWSLEDATPPLAQAVRVDTKETRVAENRILVLPSEEDVQASIYLTESGHWIFEQSDGETRDIEDQSVVSAGGASWRIELPLPIEATPLVEGELTLSRAFFRFWVTKNEEDVELALMFPGREIRLEKREHTYLLLVLARARREDSHLPEAERGWRSRSQIQKALRIDENQLNVSIHRARRQLAEAGVHDAACVVEVKRGRRRIATAAFDEVVLQR
jgi:pSer/pThr/pTyr-binding forkhead associated (FHA) protein